MSALTIHKALRYLIVAVWLTNGLFCKILNRVPRHQQIVARIFGSENAGILTKIIGLAEICMAVWILSGIKTRLSAMTQIIIVATMNIVEFLLVPDLLLWGKANSFFAVMFIAIVYVNEHFLNKNPT